MKITTQKKRYYMRNKIGFWFTRTFVSTVIFLVAYWFWIKDVPRNSYGFLYILAVVVGSSVIGTTTGMMISRKHNIPRNMQGYLKMIFNHLFTSFVMWIGFWKYAWSTMNVWILFVVFLAIRGMIFFIADYFADQILFQR